MLIYFYFILTINFDQENLNTIITTATIYLITTMNHLQNFAVMSYDLFMNFFNGLSFFSLKYSFYKYFSFREVSLDNDLLRICELIL